MKGPKPVIGLAGGIASGKSLVAEILASLGAGVIDSDRLNHEVLARPEVRRRIEAWWGPDTYAGGRCNRRKLAEIIFENEDDRRKLEGLTHPLIEQLRVEAMRRFEADPDITAIVLDSPLLFEAGLDELCDSIMFVDVAEPRRLERVRQTRGWDVAELKRREKSQKPLDSKRANSDYSVENNSDINTLRRQVERIYRQITSSSHPETE